MTETCIFCRQEHEVERGEYFGMSLTTCPNLPPGTDGLLISPGFAEYWRSALDDADNRQQRKWTRIINLTY